MDRDRARRSAERAARESYGRLVAILASRNRDVAAAEDALGEAFRQALQGWPERGVPDKPEAWLLTAARRELGHRVRHDAVRAASEATLTMLADENAEREDASPFPDERLKLLFVCAHPAIDPAAQAPLMLQTVLGLDAALIASSFLTAPATMGQRLVRAKARIKAAGIPFEAPDATELPERLGSVLDAVYATFGTGWEDVLGVDAERKGLAEEAIWLARMLVELLPRSPEAKGLLALMLYCEARRAARRDAAGRFVPLDRQDPTRWGGELVAEAERLLREAAASATLGRYQVEAAIQSVHVQRAFTGKPDAWALLALYDALARLAPTAGVLVARAAVLTMTRGPGAAIEELDRLGPDVATYQPAWAVRAQALAALGQRAEAADCYATAAGLAEDPAVREHLLALADRPRGAQGEAETSA